MIVRCVTHNAAGLNAPYSDAGFTKQSRFHLTAGRTYRVPAVGIVSGAICYLLRDDNKMPNWIPAPLFEVLDNATSGEWRFAYFHRSAPTPGLLDAIFGHEALVNDLALSDQIMNRDPTALARFGTILNQEKRES